MRDDGVEIALANELPEAGVAPGPEAFGAVATIGDVGPFVAVEEWDVPLDVGAEFGVVAGGFGAAEAAVGDLKIELGMLRHEAKERGAVLNRVGGDGEDAELAVRHEAASKRCVSWKNERSKSSLGASIARFLAPLAVLNCVSSAG